MSIADMSVPKIKPNRGPQPKAIKGALDAFNLEEANLETATAATVLEQKETDKELLKRYAPSASKIAPLTDFVTGESRQGVTKKRGKMKNKAKETAAVDEEDVEE